MYVYGVHVFRSTWYGIGHHAAAGGLCNFDSFVILRPSKHVYLPDDQFYDCAIGPDLVHVPIVCWQWTTRKFVTRPYIHMYARVYIYLCIPLDGAAARCVPQVDGKSRNPWCDPVGTVSAKHMRRSGRGKGIKGKRRARRRASGLSGCECVDQM